MGNDKLDNLVKIGQLKAEPFSQSEFDGLLQSGKAKMNDAQKGTLSLKADLTWHITHPTLCRSRHSDGTATDQEADILSSSAFGIRWIYRMNSGESWIRHIENATFPSTKAILMLMNSW